VREEDKKLSESRDNGMSFFLSVDEGFVVFSGVLKSSLDFFDSFFHQGKNEWYYNDLYCTSILTKNKYTCTLITSTPSNFNTIHIKIL